MERDQDTLTTRNQMRVAIQSGCVTKILALQRWSKNDFPPEFQNLKMHSFPIMYNTMGSKLDGLAVRDHFLPKIGLKTAILGDTIMDRLTSEGAGTQIFKAFMLYFIQSKLACCRQIFDHCCIFCQSIFHHASFLECSFRLCFRLVHHYASSCK